MRFLIDEDVPAKVLSALRLAGHEVERVARSAPDEAVAQRANAERRILVTLDKDFTNTALYPPSQYTIVHVQIHPPDAHDISAALMRLLKTLPAEKFQGLIILQRTGSIRIGA